jgi:AcrR family transcriptional regulator
MDVARAKSSPEDVPTEERLLAAAEAMIFEDGFHAVRTRTLAARAGVNMGMIRYCFGGIDELMMRLLQLNLDRFIGFQRELLEGLAADASRELILGALLRPNDLPAMFTLGVRAAFVVEDIMIHANEDIRLSAENRLNESIMPLLERLVQACPHLSREAVLWRYCCVCAGSLSLSPRASAWQLFRSLAHKDPISGPAAMDELIAVAAGALAFPAVK